MADLAVCRFNPVYGQGMSVAAHEAVALKRLLGTRSRESDPLEFLALAFFAEAAALIETPWAGAAIPDFVTLLLVASVPSTSRRPSSSGARWEGSSPATRRSTS